MHKQLMDLLPKATGRSEHTIVVNMDIRGFTPFCQSVDSLEVATYIKKVYLKILNEYFNYATYYKLTGDGLILIISYDEKILVEIFNKVVDDCM